ncbi:MAG: hypothetical protein CVT88_09560, partial [Candidatus Altiarchaeales archaeon HGW-Altiarchaeales-1]
QIEVNETSYGNSYYFYYLTGEFGKGIIPMNNGTPFYTINSNPQICSNMHENQTCNKTWQVNATGAVGKTWEFFTIFNSTLAGNSQTGKVNITIINQSAHCGCDNGTYNYTCGETLMKSCVMNCNITYNSTCFTVGANNITINGNGYSITGNGDLGHNGIYANGKNKAIIKNFNIYNFSYGIYMSSSNNNFITNNTVNSNSRGIRLDYSSNNTLTKNTANNNTYYGFYLESSNNNTIINNTANSNDYGIDLSYSSNNNLNSNFVCGNINLDINSNNWQSSGDNNTCDKANKWKDSNITTGAIGCKWKCQINKANDIFDAVEMLEYLSGEKELENLTYPKAYYDLNNDEVITLFDVFALIDNIATSN